MEEGKNIFDNSGMSEPKDQNNNIDNTPKGDTVAYDKNDQDNKESRQDMREVISDQKEADDRQDSDIEQEEESSYGEEKDTVEEGGHDKEDVSNTENISSSEYVWTPQPRGVSEVTYHFSGDTLKEHTDPASNKKKRKGPKILLIATACVLSLAVLFGGSYFATLELLNKTTVESGDTPDDTINLIKNDSPIKVQTQINIDGSVALSKADVVEKVADSIVEITTDTGAGSGIIVAQGTKYAYILTNEHVVSGASQIKITLTDSTEYMATYIDGDYSTDIAVLRVSTTQKLSVIESFGSSASLRTGDEVLAIGNAYGMLGGTVTSGIISGVDRETSVNSLKLLQIDAAVNPGNSGGGLFNMAGELVGVVNAKLSTDDSDNLGYAIPIDSIYDTIVEIIEDGYIHGRPTINIEAEYVSDPFTAAIKYGTSTTGIFVVRSSNPDIQEGDYLESINGVVIKDAISYATAVDSMKIGENAEVVLRRKQGNVWYKHTVTTAVIEYIPSGIFG